MGLSTIWTGEGPIELGKGPVRTGVTAILPRGKGDSRPCFGASFALNAAGELTGLAWLEERGLCDVPVLITNTHSVGTVRDLTIRWMRRQRWLFEWTVPIVGETYDGVFNDIDGGHIREQHVFEALDGARSGAVPEGNVGGGTGMITYEYKGGTGTASRRLTDEEGGYMVGVLVQSNYGERRHLRIGGVRVGERLLDDLPRFRDRELVSTGLRRRHSSWCGPGDGSIIVVVVTDAPLMPHQLRRLAKRPALAIGRLGGVGASMSGDFFLALSTANASVREAQGRRNAPCHARLHPNLGLTPLFEAVIDATEEAVVNALVAGESAEGANRLYVPRLPHDRIRALLAAHNILEEQNPPR